MIRLECIRENNRNMILKILPQGVVFPKTPQNLLKISTFYDFESCLFYVLSVFATFSIVSCVLRSDHISVDFSAFLRLPYRIYCCFFCWSVWLINDDDGDDDNSATITNAE